MRRPAVIARLAVLAGLAGGCHAATGENAPPAPAKTLAAPVSPTPAATPAQTGFASDTLVPPPRIAPPPTIARGVAPDGGVVVRVSSVLSALSAAFTRAEADPTPVRAVRSSAADPEIVPAGGVTAPAPAELVKAPPPKPLTARPAPPALPETVSPPPAVTSSPVFLTEPPVRPTEPRVLPTVLPPVAPAAPSANPAAPPAPVVVPPNPLPAPRSVPAAPAILVPLPGGAAPTPTPPAAPPAALPTTPAVPGTPGPIDVGGTPLTFDALSRLVDGGNRPGGGCSTCGGSCAGGQCAAGKKPCEPFHAHTAAGRFVQLAYETICCPDPCYQPRWEPITAAAFFTDAPRPVTQTRFRWDYGSRLTYPDRGEFFWARADGSGKGPKPNAPARGVPAVDYHELYLDQEIATGGGLGSVTISAPYRSVNPGQFANSAAGFGDLQITAKSLLFDRELFLFAFQMRTTVPIGQFGKGLGGGHTALEPSVIAGLRVGPQTYALAQLGEWIPLGGDKDYMGAALRYNLALNHVLWRPVRDVQFIGTWELTGMAFQDGQFTDPVLGPQKLSGQTTLNMGLGGRLFFCDTFDLGAGWNHALTGKALVEDQLRVEFRYRY